MNEYWIVNAASERKIIYGRSFGGACKSAGLNPSEWDVELVDYID